MPATTPPAALTPDEQQQAFDLYQHILALAHSGIRKTEVMVEHGANRRIIRVSPIGRGVDIALGPESDTLVTG